MPVLPAHALPSRQAYRLAFIRAPGHPPLCPRSFCWKRRISHCPPSPRHRTQPLPQPSPFLRPAASAGSPLFLCPRPLRSSGFPNPHLVSTPMSLCFVPTHLHLLTKYVQTSFSTVPPSFTPSSPALPRHAAFTFSTEEVLLPCTLSTFSFSSFFFPPLLRHPSPFCLYPLLLSSPSRGSSLYSGISPCAMM